MGTGDRGQQAVNQMFVALCRRAALSTKYLLLSTWSTWFLATATTVLSSWAVAAPPKLTHLYPAGCQRGQTVTVTASGDFSTWPVQAWADRPGLSITAEKDKGKLRIAAAADAAAGVYWLRLYNSDGAAALKPFVVGTLPELVESEPNDAPDKPQTVESRIVISGKLNKSGDVDGYRVELNAGETLVASLQGNSILGSPMDALMQVCQLVERPGGQLSATQIEAYPLAQNHDAIGTDPQIAFAAPQAGAYLVRVFAFPATPDSSIRFAGGDDYIYRLTLTTGPFIDHALPLAVPREESTVELGGWNLQLTTTAIVPPLSADASSLTPPDGPLAWVWRPDAAGAIPVLRAEYPTIVRPADAAAACELVVPGIASGRLEQPGQVDTYSFAAKKGQKVRVRVAAKALGFPTDAVLTILDVSGKVLSEADDTGRDDRDPQLDFTPPADGKYVLTVRDLARRGEMRLVYRLSIEAAEPDFSLSLAADSFVLEKGKPLEIPVNVAVRDGLREPIEIRAVGLPPGITAEPVKFEPSGDSPMPSSTGRRGGRSKSTPQASGPSVKLIVKADGPAAQAGGFPLRIEGRASSTKLVRTARFPLNLPLAGQHYAVWVTVKK